mmetsp:Transcript_15360/g.37192  ORF Transcript_15360/g.37192 Transcript_15360/m.37192 type:complete len:275 (+) Transcript_15360:66-890(+)
MLKTQLLATSLHNSSGNLRMIPRRCSVSLGHLMLFPAARMATNDEHTKLTVLAPPNLTEDASFSHLDLTMVHSVSLVLAAACFVAIRRGARPLVACARFLLWLVPSSELGTLLHAQCMVRDSVRLLQTGYILRQLSIAPSRIRAMLRNLCRRHSGLPATVALLDRWRIYPIQYCPPQWMESPEDSCGGHPPGSASRRRNLDPDGTRNRGLLHIQNGSPLVMVPNHDTSLEAEIYYDVWTQDWDVSPQPSKDTMSRPLKKGVNASASGGGSGFVT